MYIWPGIPEYYKNMVIPIGVGQRVIMEDFLERLVEIYYERNDYDFHRGTFRVRGDVVEIIPAYKQEQAIRIEFFGDEVESISEINPITGEVMDQLEKTVIFPGSHYVSEKDNLMRPSQILEKN